MKPILTLGLLLAFIFATVSHANQPDSEALFDALRNAQSEAEGREQEAALWEWWFDQSPTTEVRAALDAGIERREAYDYAAAEQHFDTVIELAPDYAEGYNQRAFIRFLRENLDSAQEDLDKTLELEPRHFGALAGTYQILIRQNRVEAAMAMLSEAVAVHPWLRERRALPEEKWPESYRALQERLQGI